MEAERHTDMGAETEVEPEAERHTGMGAERHKEKEVWSGYG